MVVFIQKIVHDPQQGQQMAVSPSRRQFVSPAISKWQSLSTEDSLLTFHPQRSANGGLFQQKTVCSLSHHRVDKWQSLPVEDSLLPKQLANGSLFLRKDSLSVKHSKRSTNGSFFKQFVCFWDV